MPMQRLESSGWREELTEALLDLLSSEVQELRGTGAYATGFMLGIIEFQVFVVEALQGCRSRVSGP